MGIMLNGTGCNEHVPKIEWYIRTVKERVQAIVNTIPFKNYPHQLIVDTEYNAIFWFNCFLTKMQFTQYSAPGQMSLDHILTTKKHCRLQFGSYVQVHDQHDNSLLQRKSSTIALNPTNNMRGTYFFEFTLWQKNCQEQMDNPTYA